MAHRTKGVTAQDVARLAGVSQATVSYVLSGRRNGALRVSDETRQRVLAAVAELNYVRNDVARSLRRQRTERICILVERLGVPYNDVLARDVQRIAESHGYSLIIAVGGELQRERRVLEQLRRGLADGVIIIPNQLSVDDLLPAVDAGLAIVVMADWNTDQALDIVASNESAAAYEAVSYLISRGHRRIAFIGHTIDRASRHPRLLGYLHAHADYAIPIDPRLLSAGARSRHEAYSAARTLLVQAERPTAILTTADIAALSVIVAAQDLGLGIPDDLAVIGTGNIPEAELVRPRLTTIGPTEREFTLIAELLFSRLMAPNPLPGRIHTTPWQLIRRESA